MPSNALQGSTLMYAVRENWPLIRALRPAVGPDLTNRLFSLIYAIDCSRASDPGLMDEVREE